MFLENETEINFHLPTCSSSSCWVASWVCRRQLGEYQPEPETP